MPGKQCIAKFIAAHPRPDEAAAEPLVATRRPCGTEYDRGSQGHSPLPGNEAAPLFIDLPPECDTDTQSVAIVVPPRPFRVGPLAIQAAQQ